ncbi:PE family protein [Mycobacterium interjectum]|uniref:PE family protein n=1 Tax=Mycobacterium interjectum TaxID=33895 RepID=UPI0021F268E4|nr:PE family protein [Mycobacterium interjectum]MCV7088951.1 PE family protein [Mycobacterium interjectum]
MSFLSVVPDLVAAAAGDLEEIGSALNSASAVAAAPTSVIAPAAQDEVSIAVARLFGNIGQEFQALSAESQAFYDQFVGGLTTATSMYVGAEAANAQQNLLNVLNVPIETLATGGGLRAVTSALESGGTGLVNGLLDPEVAIPIINTLTPLGPVVLTLYGNESVLGTLTITSGSLEVGAPLALAIDAIGAPINGLSALNASGAAFVGAVQTGNPVAAITALVAAPANLGSGFLYGEQTVTITEAAPSGSGYSTASVSIPLGGLLSPLAPDTFSLTSTDGTSLRSR